MHEQHQTSKTDIPENFGIISLKPETVISHRRRRRRQLHKQTSTDLMVPTATEVEVYKKPIPTLDFLLADGGVESLVANQRLPYEMTRKNENRDPFHSPLGTLLVIPPPGTRFGDEPLVDSSSGRLITFWSPEGVCRGQAEVIEINPEQARVIKARRNQALYELKILAGVSRFLNEINNSPSLQRSH